MPYPNFRSIGYDCGTSGGMDDLLSRIHAINDGTTTLAGYSYLRGSTVIRREHPQPQVRLDLCGNTKGSGVFNGGRGRWPAVMMPGRPRIVAGGSIASAVKSGLDA